MAGKRPTTIAEYIRAAPPAGQPHLRRLDALLRAVAPKARGVIKWGNPFYVEPRFLFAYSAHKSHLSFAPMAAAMDAFRKELEPYDTTKNFLKVRYSDPLPEALIRRMARHCVQQVRQRDSDSFW
jgi:uncharacterized protein YdhG (YjbR/CyaY superfamily)